MSKQFQLRRGNTADNTSFVGAVGEVTYDTQLKQLHIHDGTTAGGKVLADNSTVVHNTTDETISGVKTFSSPVVLDRNGPYTKYINEEIDTIGTIEGNHYSSGAIYYSGNSKELGYSRHNFYTREGRNYSQMEFIAVDPDPNKTNADGTRKNSSLYLYTDGTKQSAHLNFAPESSSNVNQLITSEWYNRNRTNCITEIPQDIKLELNDGVLTVKKDTILYIPDGFETDGTTPKFVKELLQYDTDIPMAENTGTMILCYRHSDQTGGMFTVTLQTNACSGTTDAFAGRQWHLWYDTTNNVINKYREDGTTLMSTTSFPLCQFNVINGVVNYIDQVFNGMGFIGSIFYVLPGVKGLMPYGRNEDGTLHNLLYEYSKVITRDVSINTGGKEYGVTACAVLPNNSQPGILCDNNQTYKYEYNHEKNMYYTTEQPDYPRMKLARLTSIDAKITSLTPNYSFHAVDYSDGEFIAHEAMPSDKYIDLTLGASGSTYIAPADGYVYLYKHSNADTQYITIDTMTDAHMSTHQWVSLNNGGCCGFLPVAKGVTFSVSYTAGGTLEAFRFIYTNGSK